MRDNSPSYEPQTDAPRLPRRDPGEACDSCHQFTDDNRQVEGGWLLCKPCRTPVPSLRVDSTEPETCERCTSPTVTPGCAGCDPNYTGV